MSQGRVPGWPPWLLELLKGACKRFRSLWFPWKLVSPPSGRPIRLLCSVFSDFFVIYSQNGFFLEASGSLQATHFFKLCHNSTSLFRVKGVCLSGIHLHFPLSTITLAGLKAVAPPCVIPWKLEWESKTPPFFSPVNTAWILSVEVSKKPLRGIPGRVKPVISPNNPVTATTLHASRTPAFQIMAVNPLSTTNFTI